MPINTRSSVPADSAFNAPTRLNLIHLPANRDYWLQIYKRAASKGRKIKGGFILTRMAPKCGESLLTIAK
jgi:hypothetical protein